MSPSEAVSPSATEIQPPVASTVWNYRAALLAAGLVATGFLYRDILLWLWSSWSQSNDDSHGFLVPLVSLYLLWQRRDYFPSDEATRDQRDDWKGLAAGVFVLLLGLTMRLAGLFSSVLTLEGLSIVPFLAGVVAISMGWRVTVWAAPALLFLVFMVPLPTFLGNGLSGSLQAIATSVAVFSLQTVGVPAMAEGNIIHLTNGTIGVAEACSGLRMLYAFFALCVAACLVTDRSRLEQVLIVASAVPIAIAVNCLRIVATGIAYEYLDSGLAEHIFHDLAGWLMVPLGFVLLLGVLELLRHVVDQEGAENRGAKSGRANFAGGDERV